MNLLPVRERIPELDILRGLALLGVVIVNISYDLGDTRTVPDKAAHLVVDTLASGAFYPIFAFLFGAGFSLQLARARASGASHALLYSRRLLALLVIGLAHVVFVWWGDIVHLYAILGFVLLLLRKRSDRALLICAALLWMFSSIEGPLIGSRHVRRLHVTTEETARQLDSALEAAYRHGSCADVVGARVRRIPVQVDRSLTDGLIPNALALLLLGAIAARRLLPVSEHIRAITLVFVVTSGVAIAGGLTSIIWPDISIAFKTALAGCYASALILFVQRPTWRCRLVPLASVGRMALTNYVLQSVMFTTVFYNYGLGQYKRMSPASGLALALAFYGVQLAYSHWWLAHFQQGPLEWMWRSVTYGKSADVRSTLRAGAGG